MSRFSKCELIVLAAVAVLAFLSPWSPSQVFGQTKGGAPVIVTNTPLPVSGNVAISGTPSVSVSNTPNVNISNTSPVPVTVTNGGSPEQQNRVVVDVAAMPAGDSQTKANVNLPKKAVMETVSAWCELSSSTPPYATRLLLFIYTEEGGGAQGVTLEQLEGFAMQEGFAKFSYTFETVLPRTVVDVPMAQSKFMFFLQPLSWSSDANAVCHIVFVLRYIQ